MASGRALGAANAAAFRSGSSGITAGSVRLDPNAIRQLFESENGPVAKELARRGNKVANQAKRLCPVDFGRLQSSITMVLEQDAGGLYAVVGTNVEYAAHVEFGTRYQRPQPFLRPALNAAGGR